MTCVLRDDGVSVLVRRASPPTHPTLVLAVAEHTIALEWAAGEWHPTDQLPPGIQGEIIDLACLLDVIAPQEVP